MSIFNDKPQLVERGVITLSVVASVLIICAFFSFAVMKTGANQIKKMQNWLVTNKDKAHTTASLDCAIAIFQQAKFHPQSVDLAEFEQCKTSEKVAFSLNAIASHWIFYAEKDFAKSSATIGYTLPKLATFTTSGSVNISRGNKWLPVTEASSDNEVKCNSIMAGGQIHIDLSSSMHDFIISSPKSDVDCTADSQTNILAGTKASNVVFSNDIIENIPDLSLFDELFKLNISQWEKIKAKFDKVIITGSAIDAPSSVSQCGAKIKEAIDSGYELIWVEGDCLLDGLSYAGSSNQSPLIVVKNGVLAANSSITNVQATVFQFVYHHPDGNFKRSWGVQSVNQCAQGAMKSLCLKLINQYDDKSVLWASLPFYFAAPVTFFGLYIIEIPSSLALINNEMTLGFDSSLYKHELIKGQATILKGSLHDF